MPVKPMTSDIASKNAAVPKTAALSIDLVVSHVGSNELPRAMESVVQLEAMIADPEVSVVSFAFNEINSVQWFFG